MEEYTIVQLQEKMKSGELTSRALVDTYLSRIDDIDKQGPTLNAIIEVNPDARSIAEKLDEERKSSGSRGPMHGIPVIIKDNIDTADKMMTTAGSLALKGSISTTDAFIVKKLREAGAIILAKANLSEWANFRSSRSVSGWSSRGGQTRNPYFLDRNPCGSSSGSSVAVAANLCSVAIGTETDGSVICPSTINGIVGIKPTVGLVSQSGIIPIAHTQDTAGPMGRTVEDAAILLGSLVGADSKDPKTQDSETQGHTDYTQFLDEDGLNVARLGVTRKFFRGNDRINKIINKSLQVMEDKGAILIDPVEIEVPDKIEFKHDLNIYLSKLDSNIPVHSLKEVIDFNNEHSESVMPYFDQEHLIIAEEKGNLESEEYIEAIAKYQILRDNYNKALEEHNLDAFVAPSGGPAWLIDYVKGDHFSGSNTFLAAITGYPSITVPAGYAYGLPFGISFFSNAFQEPTILKIAYAYEQATKIRHPPAFIPSVSYA
jgi:amidase